MRCHLLPLYVHYFLVLLTRKRLFLHERGLFRWLRLSGQAFRFRDEGGWDPGSQPITARTDGIRRGFRSRDKLLEPETALLAFKLIDRHMDTSFILTIINPWIFY